MLTQPSSPSRLQSPSHRNPSTILSHLLPPLLFVGLVLFMAPIGQPLEFDTDEGINLIKALLYGQGFSLYTEIWNDQPPLLTIALHYWFNLFGSSMLAGRLLVLMFAAALIWSLYQILRILVGTIPACVGIALLIISKAFVQLSASVMIGLPSLSLAVMAIYMVVLYRKGHPHRYLLLLSGGLMALSLQTKLFTVFLVPLLMAYVLDWREVRRSPRLWLRHSLLRLAPWVLSLGLVYLVIGLLSHSINYEQLLQAHLNPAVEARYESKSSWKTLRWLFQADRDFLLLALIGVGVILRQRRWDGLLPCAWLGLATLLLLNHQPIWYHHIHLLTIPLCWLAAYGVLPAVQAWQQRKGWMGRLSVANLTPGIIVSGIVAGLSALLVIHMVAGLDTTFAVLHRSLHKSEPHHHDLTVTQRLIQDRESIQWVFSDRPIYAFQAGLPTPPEIAVFSRKRWIGGNLAPDELLKILSRYQPERIVLSRFRDEIETSRPFMDYVQQHYRLLYRSEDVSLYAEEDGARQGEPTQ